MGAEASETQDNEKGAYMIKAGKWPVPSKDTIALKRFAARLRKEGRVEEAKLVTRAAHYVWSMHRILRREAEFIRI
jgi:hypothetical protein